MPKDLAREQTRFSTNEKFFVRSSLWPFSERVSRKKNISNNVAHGNENIKYMELRLISTKQDSNTYN